MRQYSESEFNDLPPGYAKQWPQETVHTIEQAYRRMAAILARYHRALRIIENDSMDERMKEVARSAMLEAHEIGREKV